MVTPPQSVATFLKGVTMKATPKWMEQLGNKLPLEGKKSYLKVDGSYWLVIDESGVVRYRGSRKNWAIGFARKYWDQLG